MDSETRMLCTRKEFSLTRRDYIKYRSLRSKILRKPGDVPRLRRNERHGPYSDEVPSRRARNGMEARERPVDEKGLIRTPTLTSVAYEGILWTKTTILHFALYSL